MDDELYTENGNIRWTAIRNACGEHRKSITDRDLGQASVQCFGSPTSRGVITWANGERSEFTIEPARDIAS
jgi:hypothetical protein